MKPCLVTIDFRLTKPGDVGPSCFDRVIMTLEGFTFPQDSNLDCTEEHARFTSIVWILARLSAVMARHGFRMLSLDNKTAGKDVVIAIFDNGTHDPALVNGPDGYSGTFVSSAMIHDLKFLVVGTTKDVLQIRLKGESDKLTVLEP